MAVGLMQLEAEVGRLDKHEMCWSCVVTVGAALFSLFVVLYFSAAEATS